MNIIKGIDRIALIIAIVCFVPGFMWGLSLSNELRKETSEYTAWYKKYSNVSDKYIIPDESIYDPFLKMDIRSLRNGIQNRIAATKKILNCSPRSKCQFETVIFNMKYKKNIDIQNENDLDHLKNDLDGLESVKAQLDILKMTEPKQYKYPPSWQKGLIATFTAFGSFFVVLYGIRFGTRGIKWFGLWIYEGFKEDDSNGA
jgi:hypothetical protein